MMMPTQWLLHHDRFIHSFKTALAVLIGYIITKSIHFPVDQWLIITIIVVMCAQINVGSMIQKSYMRFLGSLGGSIIAVLTIIFLGTNAIAIGFSITLAAGLFSYLATSQKSYNDSGTLGAVTVAIILVSKNPSPLVAAGRFLEISIGILIAALISQFILPIHARYYLRNNQAKTLRQLKKYYISTLSNPNATQDYLVIDENVAKSLIAQRKLAIDAAREPMGKSYNIKLFKQSLECEKEILRSITFMFHAYEASSSLKKILSSMASFNEFNNQLCKILDEIAYVLENKISSFEILLPQLTEYQHAMQSIIKTLPQEEVVYANSFLFSAQVLLDNIKRLINIVQAMNHLKKLAH